MAVADAYRHEMQEAGRRLERGRICRQARAEDWPRRRRGRRWRHSAEWAEETHLPTLDPQLSLVGAQFRNKCRHWGRATASSRRIELMAGGSPRSADGSKLERDHACDQRSRIELAHNRFEAAQAARKRMQRIEVAVAHRSERREAEIDEIGRKRHSVVYLKAGERAGSQDADQCVERHKHKSNREIEQYGANYAMIGDPSRSEHGAGDNPGSDKADHEPPSADFERDVTTATAHDQGDA